MPDQERRHRHAGRREDDPRNVASGALVAAAADGLFPQWKKEDVIKWLTIIIGLGTIIGGTVTFVSTRFASRAEIESQVKPVAQKLEIFAGSTNVRLQNIERDRATEKVQSEATRDLITGLARLTCLDYQRQRSSSLADAAGLPCDSLLNRRR